MNRTTTNALTRSRKSLIVHQFERFNKFLKLNIPNDKYACCLKRDPHQRMCKGRQRNR